MPRVEIWVRRNEKVIPRSCEDCAEARGVKNSPLITVNNDMGKVGVQIETKLPTNL